MNETAKPGPGADRAGARKPLTPAAERALAEAQERHRARAARQEKDGPPAKEVNGRGGLDPTRYGDWEIKGLISDF